MRRAMGILVAVLFASCGGAASADRPAAASGTARAAQQARLVVEGDDATRIVDPSSGAVIKTLPGGVLSPTTDLIVSVRGAAGTKKTAVTGWDLTGNTVLSLALGDDYALPNSYGAAPSGFSPNGKWLVLVARDANLSHFAVIDVAHNVVAKVVDLSLRFTFDAIHNDGTAMYVIEHPQAGSTAYNVRLYDLSSNTLKPDVIFDKTAIAQYDPTHGLMDGTFHVSVAPTTGDWSFGLYMRPNGSPFVHALNVPGHYAQCIVDLAGVWTKSSRFSMVLADDGRYLYVVDGGMGTISVIDALSQKVSRRGTFSGHAADANASDVPSASAVISRDGARVFASGAKGVAVIQVSDLSLTRWVANGLSPRSLAISDDGRTLLALSGDAVQRVDTVSGAQSRLAVVGDDARSLHLVTVR